MRDEPTNDPHSDDGVSRRAFTAAAAGILSVLLGGRRGSAPGRLTGAGTPDGATRWALRAASPWSPREPLLAEIPTLMELTRVPGMAMAVIDGGKVETHCFGAAKREMMVDISGTTLFEAASLGKPVFAYAVLRLAQAGLLDIERPLSSYIDIPEVTDARTKSITARHVLSHTTGMENWRLKPGAFECSQAPGRAFSYSGEGFFYLQRVVERITGLPIQHYMNDAVFKPLGMAATSYVWTGESNATMAIGYDERGDALEVYADIGRKLIRIADAWKKPMEEWRYADAARATAEAFPNLPTLPIYMAPNVAGSLLTTIEDYSKFLIAMVAETPPPGLTAQTRKLMFAPAVQLNSALSWGLGWGIERNGDDDFIWHWGANGSFRNFVLADPRRHRGVIMLTNSANGPKLYERVINNSTRINHPAFLWFQV